MATNIKKSQQLIVLIGIIVGIVISAIENFAFDGEISPFAIVILLLIADVTYGGLWGIRGWISAFITWMFLPLAHLFKHIFSLKDTLSPNTYVSILLMAIFCFIITAIGFISGTLIRKFLKHISKRNSNDN